MHYPNRKFYAANRYSNCAHLGINPYPAEAFNVTAWAQDITENFETNPDTYKHVTLAGRIMSRRIMGSASFAELQDSTGRIQIYLKRDDICPGEDKTYTIPYLKNCWILAIISA